MAEIQFIDLSGEIKADPRGMSFFPWQGRLQAPGELPSTFHLISIRPGQSRGHHLHPGHAEYLYPFHGRAVFTWEAAPGQVRERVISGDRTLIHIPPGLAHAVTNPGPETPLPPGLAGGSGPGPGEPETIPHPLERLPTNPPGWRQTHASPTVAGLSPKSWVTPAVSGLVLP